jgi:hypothetical protein
MNNRYHRPPAPPPDLRRLDIYLRHARPTLGEQAHDPAETEARRVEAVAVLRALARQYVVPANNSLPGSPDVLLPMPRQLRQFLSDEGLRILLAENPVAALGRFLGFEERRGRGRRKADNLYRDRVITSDVVACIRGGATVEDACAVVAKAAALSEDAVRKIYLADPDVRFLNALRHGLLWLLNGDRLVDGRDRDANRSATELSPKAGRGRGRGACMGAGGPAGF